MPLVARAAIFAVGATLAIVAFVTAELDILLATIPLIVLLFWVERRSEPER